MDTNSIVPRENKNLSACLLCKLVMQRSQWDECKVCPNCRKDAGSTPRFSGLTSFMHPELSWVAKFTESRNKIPGVYAMHIFGDGDEYAQGEDEEYSEDDDEMSQN